MKGKMSVPVLAVVVVLLAAACGGKTVGYVEEFKTGEKTQVPADWHPNGLVYMREDKEMGLVLCVGGTGEMLEKGIDSIAIDLDVPSEGMIIEFEYKVYAAAGEFAYFVLRASDNYEWQHWMDQKEATDWKTASFILSEACRNFGLIFEAKRAEAGSTGVVFCIDNFRIRQAAKKGNLPTPIP